MAHRCHHRHPHHKIAQLGRHVERHLAPTWALAEVDTKMAQVTGKTRHNSTENVTCNGKTKSTIKHQNKRNLSNSTKTLYFFFVCVCVHYLFKPQFNVQTLHDAPNLHKESLRCNMSENTGHQTVPTSHTTIKQQNTSKTCKTTAHDQNQHPLRCEFEKCTPLAKADIVRQHHIKNGTSVLTAVHPDGTTAKAVLADLCCFPLASQLSLSFFLGFLLGHMMLSWPAALLF